MREHTFTPDAAPGASVTVSYPYEGGRRRFGQILTDGIEGPLLDEDGKQMRDDDGAPLQKVAWSAIEEHRKAVLSAHVVAVKGLRDEDGDEITDGATLYERAPTDVVIEVVSEILKRARLNEAQKKTSSGSSDSAQTERGQPGGTADAAGGNGSTGREAVFQGGAPTVC